MPVAPSASVLSLTLRCACVWPCFERCFVLHCFVCSDQLAMSAWVPHEHTQQATNEARSSVGRDRPSAHTLVCATRDSRRLCSPLRHQSPYGHHGQSDTDAQHHA